MITFAGNQITKPIDILLVYVGLFIAYYILYRITDYFLNIDVKYMINIMIWYLIIIFILEFFVGDYSILSITINEHKLNLVHLVGVIALLRVRDKL